VLLALLGTSSWPLWWFQCTTDCLASKQKELFENTGFGGEKTVGTKIRVCLEFDERELIVDRLKQEAESLGLTVEQLIKRFVVDALAGDDDSPSIPGENLEDFLEKNGVIRPRQDD